jgi:hypothetical protein
VNAAEHATSDASATGDAAPRWVFAPFFVLRHAGFPFDWVESLGLRAPAIAAVGALVDALDAPPHDGARPSAAWLAELRARAATLVAEETRRIDARLVELANDERVAEAVFLSSPSAHRHTWTRLSRGGLSDDADDRRVRRVGYAYLQRLCAKNETTSFFGPMGDGRIVPSAPTASSADDGATTDAHLPVRIHRRASPPRRTNLAYWACERLAAAIAADPELGPRFAVRRHPLFTIDVAAGLARCRAADRERVLDDEEQALLASLDRAPHPAPSAALDRLLADGVVARRPWFPSDVADPLAALTAAIAEVPVSSARTAWLARLGELAEAVTAFGKAGFPERRRLLDALGARIASLTGRTIERAGGKLYTDRLVVNEEAASSFSVTIDEGFARRLAATLSPLLEHFAAAGEAHHATARAAIASAMRPGEQLPLTEYATRFAALEPPAPTTVEWTASGTAPRSRGPASDASTHYALPDASTRYAMPDVSLSLDEGGALGAVLTSIRHQVLMPSWMFALSTHARAHHDWCSAWVRAHAPSAIALATGRHNKGYYRFPGPRVAWALAEAGASERGEASSRAGDCTVHAEPSGPALRDAEGRPRTLLLPLADLSLHPPFVALGAPPLVRVRFSLDGDARARITSEGVVLQRRRVQLAARELATLREKDPLGRLVAAERIRRRHALPRFGFARVAGERKPFLVDWSSPLALALLTHHAREAPQVTVEEMSPGPEALWLRDERGRYTSELRMMVHRA